MDRTGRGKGQRIRGRWTRRLASVTSDRATPPGSGLTRPSWRPVERLCCRELLRNKFGGQPFLFSCSSLVGEELPNCDPVGEKIIRKEGGISRSILLVAGWNHQLLAQTCFQWEGGFILHQLWNRKKVPPRPFLASFSLSLCQVSAFRKAQIGFCQTLKWLCDFFPILLSGLASVSLLILLVPIVFLQQYYSHYHSLLLLCHRNILNTKDLWKLPHL